MRKNSLNKSRSKGLIVILIIVIIFFVVFYWYKNVYKSYKTYTVVNGTIEKTTENKVYIVKDEKIIPIDSKQAVVPIISQDKRVSKDETIAIYQNSKYNEYKVKIEEMDTEISLAIKDLPVVYSNDISDIEEQIRKNIEQMSTTNSYLKMQEYKTKLDELAYKKIMVIGNLSPAGSSIKDLIAKRNEYEAQSKKNADVIKSTTAGIISYKIDAMEDYANSSYIQNASIDQVKDLIQKYNVQNINTFGIKVIDNYLSYLIVMQSKGDMDKYIEESHIYNIIFEDKNNIKISGSLQKRLEDNENFYCIFKVTNKIENISDLRCGDVKVIWNVTNGMMLPNSTLKQINNIQYVTMIKDGKFIEIPVKIKALSDNMCIVVNYNEEEKSSLGLKSDYFLSLYDQVII